MFLTKFLQTYSCEVIGVHVKRNHGAIARDFYQRLPLESKVRTSQLTGKAETQIPETEIKLRVTD